MIDNRSDGDNTKTLLESINLIMESDKLSGVVKCPRCGGDLHYGKSAYNGHFYGVCVTKKCIRIMK